jgi:hypothetical protein
MLPASDIELNTQVKDNGGALDQEQADAVRIEYRALLMEGEVECPPPDEDTLVSP